jgi:RHS repeat-associated protein
MSYRTQPPNYPGSTSTFSYRYDLGLPAEAEVASARVVDAPAYDPAAPEPRFAFAGSDVDSATALEYNRARYYDPRPGRWLAADPVACAAPNAELSCYPGAATTASPPQP